MSNASVNELCSRISAEQNSQKLIDLSAELREFLAGQQSESDKKASRLLAHANGMPGQNGVS